METEQLWVDHDCQSVLDKAEQSQDFPKAGVSLRDEDSSLIPLTVSEPLISRWPKAWTESFPA